MAAPKDNQYAKGNKGGKGGRSKYKPEYVEIATRLCERGLIEAGIPVVLGGDRVKIVMTGKFLKYKKS